DRTSGEPWPSKPAGAMGRDSGRRRSPYSIKGVRSAAGPHRGNALLRRAFGGGSCRCAQHFYPHGKTRLGRSQGLVARGAFRRRARMTPERWAEITGVFRLALEKPATDRGAFLDEACGNDEVLRRNVERLLAGEAEPSLSSPLPEFLEGGPLES